MSQTSAKKKKRGIAQYCVIGCRRLSQFLDLLNVPRHHHHQQQQQHHQQDQPTTFGCGLSGSSSSNTSSRHSSPVSPYSGTQIQGQMAPAPPHPPLAGNESSALCFGNSPLCGIIINISNGSNNVADGQHQQPFHSHHHYHHQQQNLLHVEQPQQQTRSSLYSTTCLSYQSEIFFLNLTSGEINDAMERTPNKDEFGTQRVYKKTSPNCVLTLYLPSREITLSGTTPSILRGIVYVDPKAIQGYRVYAQLTLTFRYGREDEEVMGLRFCNEAIMSLHQIWPRNEEPSRDSLSPLQEALLKRLGDGAHPFTLTLTAQAPPSVQLVPAKRYYGAPIGTSYDVRCFIADKTDEKFHRRASVKMGVRVIYRTDVFNHGIHGAENFAALFNNPVSSPPVTLACTQTTATSAMQSQTTTSTAAAPTSNNSDSSTLVATDSNPSSATIAPSSSSGMNETKASCGKSRKSERGDSFPKLRLSPKSFRFSSRFGRSKSEVEKCPNDPFYNYSKSFQEYDSAAGVTTCGSGGGPQGAVDKPFLLQDGRVGLRASLDKAWYTHGEDVCVTINIRNDSRKTVRKIRVCAIQHVDVCMFNNGKFKNVVADSDNLSPPPIDRTVPPGATLNTTVTLKPQRGPTKNWIALEDTLQRSTEPDEITGAIAASAVRTPHFLMQANHSPNYCSSPAVFIPPAPTATTSSGNPSTNDERNVFAIYVSYYVKVKLTLSGMGGELSLKLPFVLVHIDEEQRHLSEMQVEKLALDDVPASKKNGNKSKALTSRVESNQEFSVGHTLDRIESVDDDRIHIKVSQVTSGGDGVGGSTASPMVSSTDEDIDHLPSTSRRRTLVRSETIAKDLDEEPEVAGIVSHEENLSKLEHVIHVAQIHSSNMPRFEEHPSDKDHLEMEHKSVSPQVSHELSINQIQEIHTAETSRSRQDSKEGPTTADSSSNGV
ncbi:uncharacterized protein LOC142230801 [Haematobia irritans]|uniref:uncharacterized protein LOC142230801 n=1 Tax=Haematobia irritans TaxID=7368 RepID=UPI003F506A7F